MPTKDVERGVWKHHIRHVPGGAGGTKPIWPLPREPRAFPVLSSAPGPRGDICCPPGPGSPRAWAPAAQLCSRLA